MFKLTRLTDIQLSFIHVNRLSDVSILDTLMSFAYVRRYAPFPLASHVIVSHNAVRVRYVVLGSPSKNLTYILSLFVETHLHVIIIQYYTVGCQIKFSFFSPNSCLSFFWGCCIIGLIQTLVVLSRKLNDATIRLL